MSGSGRGELARLIREQAFRHRPDRPFTLASGRTSPYYFNCKEVTLTGRGFNLLGPVLWEEMQHLPAARLVGGLTLGADPLALAMASYATARGAELDAVVIRKEPKGHGTQQWVEGRLTGDLRLLVLDDVVTTGGSTVKAIQRAAESGLQVMGALVLVDREEEDGMAAIRSALAAAGAPGGVRAAFRASDFLP